MISTESTSTQPDSKMTIPLVEKVSKNPRNMPSVIFIENIEDYLEKYGYEKLIEEINVYYRYITI